MKRLAISLIAGVSLSGCATQPPPNPWESLEPPSGNAVKPIECGDFPFPSAVYMKDQPVLDENGRQVKRIDNTRFFYAEDLIVYDNAAVNALEAYRTCSEANYSIAETHAMQIDELKLATRGLIDAGKAQRRISDMRAEIIEDERRHNFYEKISLYAIILGLSFAL